jgi:hypothetical protein
MSKTKAKKQTKMLEYGVYKRESWGSTRVGRMKAKDEKRALDKAVKKWGADTVSFVKLL